MIARLAMTGLLALCAASARAGTAPPSESPDAALMFDGIGNPVSVPQIQGIRDRAAQFKVQPQQPLPPNVQAVSDYVAQHKAAILQIPGITDVTWSWPDGDAMIILTIDPKAEGVTDSTGGMPLSLFEYDFPQAKQWDLVWLIQGTDQWHFVDNWRQVAATPGAEIMKTAAVSAKWSCELADSLRLCTDAGGTAYSVAGCAAEEGWDWCRLKDGRQLRCFPSGHENQWSCGLKS